MSLIVAALLKAVIASLTGFQIRGDTMTLPPVLDLQFYRDSFPDLHELEPHELVEHYATIGMAEGRPASAAALRNGLLSIAAQERSVLEIGPFCNPCLRGDKVAYFDVLNRDDLIARANSINRPVQDAPEIDYVSPTGDLSIVDQKFSATLSSHCIEHQPDLIRHLLEVSRILEPGGRYYLIVPDKRYCFDYYLPESTIADVLQAYVEERKVHSLRSVVEHRALVTHNDPGLHWRGLHAPLKVEEPEEETIRKAITEYHNADGGYIDVHAWQFTPESFKKLIKILNKLHFCDLYAERVYQTPRDRQEFTAVLRKKT